MNELDIKNELKNFICENLGVDEAVLDFDTPLFDETKIGLDSIDSIEIISFIDEKYQVSMTGVERENFQNINTIAAYIIANQN